MVLPAGRGDDDRMPTKPLTRETIESLRAGTTVFDRLRSYLTANPVAGLRMRPPSFRSRAWVLAPIYAAVALGIGLGTGILEPQWPSITEALIRSIGLVIFPALIEEFVFRGILLPRSLMDANWKRQWLAIGLSTIAFVLHHPMNHLLIGFTDTSLFVDPGFLVIVAALGITSGFAYLRSGSLWAPIAIHWATVVVWNLFLGR